MKHFLKISALLIILGVGISATTVDKDKLFEITKNIEIFVNVYKKLNAEYVDDLDPNELMRVGLDAMMHSLDPYTIYWSESQIEGYRLSDEDTYQGLGATTKIMDGFPTIVEPYEEGPAMEAGLISGDKIVEINGVPTQGKSDEEITALSMGVPGTQVNLLIERPGDNEPFLVELTRGKADKNNVPYHGMLKDNIGYITLTTFTPNASANILKAMKALKAENTLDGLILDLRGNGGGLLSEAVAISNLFIPKNEVVVSTRSKVDEHNKIYKTTSTPYDLDIPLAVMIDNRSASASEIVSGVMQDYDRGVIVGQRSFGKGLVQNTGDVGYNAKMKLTISKYYIPSRRCIQAVAYQDGEPVNIPDEKRSKFKTKNGRTVLDGGGITPDIRLEPEENSEFTQALKEHDLIFKYVTAYHQRHDTIAQPRLFTFSGYDDFKAYVLKSGFKFESALEQELKKMISEDSQIRVTPEMKQEIEQTLKNLDAQKSTYLETYKNEIIREIELDIISRYYYQSGKAAHRLNGDTEIIEAIDILKDQQAYNKILGK